MKIEGIVLKVTDKQIVLLCPENGSFKNVTRSEGQFPLIGERFVYEQKAKVFPNNRWVKYSAVACVLALVLFVSNLVFQPYQAQAAAYVVALDINPSIEVYADKDLWVTNLKALNKDGQKIIGEIDYKGKSLSDTLKLIIEQCVKDHFLKPDHKGLIAITVVPIGKSKQLSSHQLKELQSAIEETLSQHSVSAGVEISMDTEQTLENARQQNISVNKYKVYRKLVDQGIEVSIEEINGTSMETLFEEAQMDQEYSEGTPYTEEPLPSGESIEPEPTDTSSEDQNPEETPFIAPEETPSVTPEETPLTAPEETPTVTPKVTPFIAPNETPFVAPEATPFIAPEEAPSVAPEATPFIAPEEMTSVAPEETPSVDPTATP